MSDTATDSDTRLVAGLWQVVARHGWHGLTMRRVSEHPACRWPNCAGAARRRSPCSRCTAAPRTGRCWKARSPDTGGDIAARSPVRRADAPRGRLAAAPPRRAAAARRCEDRSLPRARAAVRPAALHGVDAGSGGDRHASAAPARSGRMAWSGCGSTRCAPGRGTPPRISARPWRRSTARSTAPSRRPARSGSAPPTTPPLRPAETPRRPRQYDRETRLRRGAGFARFARRALVSRADSANGTDFTTRNRRRPCRVKATVRKRT